MKLHSKISKHISKTYLFNGKKCNEIQRLLLTEKYTILLL